MFFCFLRGPCRQWCISRAGIFLFLSQAHASSGASPGLASDSAQSPATSTSKSFGPPASSDDASPASGDRTARAPHPPAKPPGRTPGQLARDKRPAGSGSAPARVKAPAKPAIAAVVLEARAGHRPNSPQQAHRSTGMSTCRSAYIDHRMARHLSSFRCVKMPATQRS